MAAYSPSAITACWNTIKQAIPSAQLGGIYANKPGYHNSRNQNSAGDYSVQRADDKKGDGNAASALDVTMNDAQMKACTQRLIDATLRGDARMNSVREFFGTTNGRTVTGLDVRDKRWVTSDASHLWHVHISFYRKYATDHAALQQVASVFTGSGGGTTTTPEGKDWFDMATQADLRKVLDDYMGTKVLGGQSLPMRLRRQSNRMYALLPSGDPEKAPNRNELFDALARRIGIPDIIARLDRIEKKIK